MLRSSLRPLARSNILVVRNARCNETLVCVRTFAIAGKRREGGPTDHFDGLIEYIDHEIPAELVPQKDAIQDYILNTFLTQYTEGARLRKLQRDLAFRVNNTTNTKLELKKLLPIVGELERAHKIKIRFGKSGKIILYKPSDAEKGVAELNQKTHTPADTHLKTEDN